MKRKLPVLGNDGKILQPHHPRTLLRSIKNEERRYCIYPFIHICVASDYVKPCNWLRDVPNNKRIPSTNIPEHISDAWGSDGFDLVRKGAVDGSFMYCDLPNCPDYNSDQRYLKTMSEIKVEYPEIASFIKSLKRGGPVLKFEHKPRILNLAYDTQCNLSCPSCNRLELPKFKSDQLELIGDTLVHIGDNARTIHIAGMGDPFSSTHYLNFLRNLNPNDFPLLEVISLNTNALKLTEDMWLSLPERVRKLVHTMYISMDGVTKESFETNRWPAKWCVFLERMEFVAKLKRTDQIKLIELYFVYQENNFREFFQAIEFARQHGADRIFFARIRDWKGWGNDKMNKVDVHRESHPMHQEFLEIEKMVRSMKIPGLQIILMD